MKIRKPSAGIEEESDGIPLDLGSGADFIGLGIKNCDRNKTPKSAINSGKKKEIDGWGAFLGLGIDSSSNYEEINNHWIGRALNPNDEIALNPPTPPPQSEINQGGGRALNPPTLNPTPLRSYHPTQGFFKGCSSSSSASTDHGACCCGKKRMREDKKNKGGGGGGPKRSRRVGEFHPDPTSPPQELVQVVGPNVRPVFLYRKQLAEWDTRENQNRLFVNDRKKLMDFMTEEERLAVEDPEKPGTDLVGIDSLGREYGLRSNLWASLDKVVVNRGWYEILAANGAEKGDWVHLWAFRRAREFCLYVDFRHQP